MKTGTFLEGLRPEPPKACPLESAAHVGALSQRRLGVADDEVWVPNRCQVELVAFVFVAFRVGGHTVRCARAVRKVGCFPLPVATGPRVLNSAPPMLFGMDHARFCRGVVCRGVPGINNVMIGAVRALCENASCVTGHQVTVSCVTNGRSLHSPLTRALWASTHQQGQGPGIVWGWGI